ncbi:uncharacterized protein H6S33_012797 [Morchella sextelata]|uniref:uncharacterized protein n=1 Tax=Morchella sextelata TaxID=1174677 RepID=UPI001D04377C|nr:uncharacterized protein H6S33_012797 [Morchella sextelata]KAH0609311.1 hypothetical protein H6S33_012797 [Morchella sextelata]
MSYALYILLLLLLLLLLPPPVHPVPHTLPSPSCPPVPPSPLGTKWHTSNTCYYPSKYLPTSFTCETSVASPLTSEVLAAMDDLLAKKGEFWCEQENPGGSRCTQVARGVAICGALGSRMQCKVLVGVVRGLVDWCPGDRVGGVVEVGMEEVAGVVRVVGRRVVVY